MRRYKTFLFLAALTVLAALSSCTLETSGNGDFDGFWHLERVDTIATEGSCDLSGELRFWAVQMSIINVSDKGNSDNGGVDGYLARFDMDGTSLRLYDMYVNNREEGDIQVDDPSLLSPFGINSLDESFTVEKLNSGSMVLRTDQLRLYFKKM